MFICIEVGVRMSEENINAIEPNKKVKMAYIDVNYVVNQSKDVQELKTENAQKNRELQIWLSKVNTNVMEQEKLQR
mgnify:CR=1 FL=1